MFITFSRLQDEVQGPTLGPFEWVQLTYTELRVAPDGEVVAYYSAKQDWWYLVDHVEPWSDVVIGGVAE